MGAKKKSLATRLAKMSDEERARYLQRKAELEEEARRRKEHLIATFMKNKIKKEDAFSRLNLAKINQNWHQILRINKCKEMKENVEHLKRYLDRVLAYKNRTINNLLHELEMVEVQFSHNFQSHSTQIDKMIESQEEYLRKMETQYGDELEEMLETMTNERQQMLEQSKMRQTHLKTITHAQGLTAKKALKETLECNMRRKDEMGSSFRADLATLRRRREAASVAIWRQIAAVVRAYVHRTDLTRLHIAELKCLDAESAAEIAAHQERITHRQEELIALQSQLDGMLVANQEQIERLSLEIGEKQAVFLVAKQRLHWQIEADERKIRYCCSKAGEALDALEAVVHRGNQIVGLLRTCSKLETPDDSASKYLPMAAAIAAGHPMPPIRCSYTPLDKLENFWLIYSKVDVDFRELTAERRIVMQENNQLKAMFRAVLEATTMAQSIPNSKPSTRVTSKTAPFERILS